MAIFPSLWTEVMGYEVSISATVGKAESAGAAGAG
jgi:hypothetical protein